MWFFFSSSSVPNIMFLYKVILKKPNQTKKTNTEINQEEGSETSLLGYRIMVVLFEMQEMVVVSFRNSIQSGTESLCCLF